MVTVNIPGIYHKVYRSKKTGQSKTYYYHRASGVRLPDDPTSLEFREKVERLDKAPVRPKTFQPAERTLGQLILEYKDSDRYRKLAASTKSEYDRHMKYLEALRDGPVSGFTALSAEKIKKKYAEKGTLVLGDAVVRTLSVLLSYAVVPLGWIPANPLKGTHQGARRQRSKIGQRPYEEYEIATFRAKNPLGTRARLAFELGLSTGLRISDLTRVERQAVLSGKVSIITGKTGSHVVVPVTRMAREALLAYDRTRRAFMGDAYEPSRYAVCRLDGEAIGKRRLSADLCEAYVAAEFDEQQRTHALRYTAAVRLLELDRKLDEIAEIIGHAGAEMTQKYVAKKRKAKLARSDFDAIDPSVGDAGFI